MGRLSFATAFVILMFVPTFVHTEIVPAPGSESLPDLFDAASFVFAGEILSVDPSGEIIGKWDEPEMRTAQFNATARPDRIYKGQPTALVRIIYGRPMGRVCTVSR